MENPAFALEFYRSTSSRTYQMYRKVLSLTLFTAEENTAMYCLMPSCQTQKLYAG